MVGCVRRADSPSAPTRRCRRISGHECGQKSGHKCGQKCSQKCRQKSGYKCGQKYGYECGKNYGQEFWIKRRVLLVLLLLLMTFRSSVCGAGTGAGAGAALGAQLVCAKTPGLTDRQRALCRAAPAAMQAITDGLRMAYAECVTQLRGRRWNCSGVTDGKHFAHVISMATKEAAYTYAITSAGVTHALGAACARGELPACGCTSRRRSAGAAWQWAGGGGACAGGARGGGGAGAAARGARLARRFLDARELEHDARALMNLHNNRLGRKMVKEQQARECRCHGVSGSCSVRTCWRALPAFRRVARALTDKYARARQVAAIERGTRLDGRLNLQLVVKKGHGALGVGRAARRSELVYLQPSPSYCEPAPTAAARGTHRRLCNLTSAGEDGCGQLCCGRGFRTERVTARVQCRCAFHWCCRVRCDTCLSTALLHVCN